jgi:hypothetical protein
VGVEPTVGSNPTGSAIVQKATKKLVAFCFVRA